GPDSVYCTMSPFQHIAGVGNVLIVLAMNGTIVLAPPFSRESWAWLGSLGTTHALLVAAMGDTLLEEGGVAIGTVGVARYGRGPRGQFAGVVIGAGVRRRAHRKPWGVVVPRGPDATAVGGRVARQLRAVFQVRRAWAGVVAVARSETGLPVCGSRGEPPVPAV